MPSRSITIAFFGIILFLSSWHLFGGGNDNYANAVAGYVSWQLTEKLSLHGRGEYVSTDTGLFGTGTAIEPGGNSEIFALTGTLQYDLWKNVISRLEVRWDHQAGDDDMIGAQCFCISDQ